MTGALPEPLCGGTAWASHTDIPDGPYEMHDPDTWCVYLSMATDILWAATGRRWRGAGRTATATLRAAPPNDDTASWAYHRTWGHCPCAVTTVGGLWGPRMRHHEPSRVRMPHDDITAITSVTIDGAPFTGWSRDGAWLVRDDGRGWPMCGDRVVIGYTYGRNPPAAGRAMAVELAVELGRGASSSPDRACSLPRRLQSVTRQGISFAALDDLDFLDKGLTGLYPVDVWIRSVNPKGRAQSAQVWSPDLLYSRRTS